MTKKERAEALIDMYNPYVNYKYNSAKALAETHCDCMMIELKKFEKYWANDVIDPVAYWDEIKKIIPEL